MASTYTVNSGIELIATGEQSGTWGDTTNVNLQIVDRLTGGVGAITLSGTTHTLTTSDGSLSDGQYKVLVLGGSPSGTNTITVTPNDQQKLFFVKNGSGQSAVFTQGSGGNVTIPNGESAIIYCDGAGAGAQVVNISATLDLSTFLQSSNNLSDVADAPTALSNLGVTSTAAELNKLDGFSGEVGFRAVPQSGSAKTTSYTLQTSDVGQFIEVGSGGSITVPDATFSTGDVVALFNNTTGDITITCSITTAYIGGTDSDQATVTLATRGICNVLFLSGTVCVITGNVS